MAALKRGQALWLHASFEREDYAFLITSDGFSVQHTISGEPSLAELVDRVKSTLDQRGNSDIIPFGYGFLTKIFKILFSSFEEEIQSVTRVILVPDGLAQQISFAALTRSSGRVRLTIEGADARFLGFTHALEITPSVAGLIAGRSPEQTTGHGGDFVGFGDLVLSGPSASGCDRGDPFDRLAGIARDGVIATMFVALPETALELQAIAKSNDRGLN
jgi:hypothetical protein